MNVDDRDDVDSEHTVLSLQQLDRSQNYCNHLVVFVDNNLNFTRDHCLTPPLIFTYFHNRYHLLLH